MKTNMMAIAAPMANMRANWATRSIVGLTKQAPYAALAASEPVSPHGCPFYAGK
jgi:hypothetical protein